MSIDNKRIAEWAGLDIEQCRSGIPYYPNDPPACFGLLDVLVEKGYWVDLSLCAQGKSCQIGIEPGVELYASLVQPTKELAILEAVSQVIEKEAKRG